MRRSITIAFLSLCTCVCVHAQTIESIWSNPPEDSRPWNYWYWMNGAYSREGITADLEAMKANGIGGSYQFTIGAVPDEPYITPSYNQLTPEWWDIWSYAVKEADRLGLKIAFNACDGWAIAGGPWITPEMSMQVVTWSSIQALGGQKLELQLPQPDSLRNYYRDIATFAYPSRKGEGVDTYTLKPEVVSDHGGDLSRLLVKGNKKPHDCHDKCWFEYRFAEPFTCRTIYVKPRNSNYQSLRLILEVSDDGVNYRRVTRMAPPRMGWYSKAIPGYTWTIEPVTAKYFRFIDDPTGSEIIDEDMDKPKGFEYMSLLELAMSSSAGIHQFESKNGAAWRVAPFTTSKQLKRKDCVKPSKLIDITEHVDANGVLNWDAPDGEWTIIRMGYTTNGAENGPAGGAVGLECDKFNPEAIKLQMDSWIGHLRDMVGADVFSRVVKYVHVDSWECGTQNWSPVFREEFLKRRGYDLVKVLPIMAGIPVKSVRYSENVLLDVRKTISELYADTFNRLVKEYAESVGCEFSAEALAPVTMSDNMMHYRYTDVPMGEFWLNSPTQDRPTDILDAISGAHVYGKKIAGAEAFTETCVRWNEYPGMMKGLQDLEYANGINRFVFHVNVHHPWMDGSKLPGLTLWNFGLFFQRDQVWWKQSKAWMDYTIRCQALLQCGQPVVDMAVWTGDDFPRRSIHPERMVPLFPGLFGEKIVQREKERLAGDGLDRDTSAIGVVYGKHMTLTEHWVNPMHGYKYDSFNTDALVNLAKAEDERITLPGGMSYGVLVIPGTDKHSPNKVMTKESAAAIKALKRKGVPVIDKFPYTAADLAEFGIVPDFTATDADGNYLEGLVFNHRRTESEDIYFIANNDDVRKEFAAGLRVKGRYPELWIPTDGKIIRGTEWEETETGISMPLALEPYESVFVILKDQKKDSVKGGNIIETDSVQSVDGPWKVTFKGRRSDRVVTFGELTDWKDSGDPQIRYFSGTAFYDNSFGFAKKEGTRYFIEFDNIHNIATVKINGKDCGTLWTRPYRLDVTDALADGSNSLEIEVANTWANHVLGMNENKIKDDSFWTTASKWSGLTLQPAGITGDITITCQTNGKL